MLQAAKDLVRLLDAQLCRGERVYTVDGVEMRLAAPRCWQQGDADAMAAELRDYVAARERLPFDPERVLDCGAAVGVFTLLASQWFPAADVLALEPDRRQRILFRKNARAAGLLDRATLLPVGAFDREGSVAFRMHGDMSSVEGVTDVLRGYAFVRRAQVTTLDALASAHELMSRRLLVKMDIEGAEIEALAGAKRLLQKHPSIVLWVQAYHVRDGESTARRCLECLEAAGLDCESDENGFIIARRSAG